MPKQVYANNVRVIVAQSISNVSPVIQLDNASRLPVVGGGDFFTLTLFKLENGIESDWEIVKVLDVTGNQITVERGQDGTEAKSWALGTPGEIRNNNLSMSLLRDAAEAATNAASSALNAANGKLSPAELSAPNGATKVGYNATTVAAQLTAILSQIAALPNIVDASNTVKGIAQFQSIDFDVVSGVVSLKPKALPEASTTQAGILQLGTGLTKRPGTPIVDVTVSGSGGGNDNVTYDAISTLLGTVTPPAAVSGYTVKKQTASTIAHVDFTNIIDPASDDLKGDLVNVCLKFASNLFQILCGTAYYGSHAAQCIEAHFPGRIRTNVQIINPSNVKANFPGKLVRVKSGELADSYMPVFVCTPFSHVKNLNIQCHETGIANGGNGFAGHRLFTAVAMTMLSGGTGYVVNEEFNLPRSCPLLTAPRIRVNTVNGNGTILTYTVVTYGSYDCHLSVVDEQVNAKGARFKPSQYEPDFSENHYSAGVTRQFGEMIIEHLHVNEPPETLTADATKGLHTGIHIMGLNSEINQMFVRRGRQAFQFTNGSDCRVTNMNSVLAGTHLRINGYGAINIAMFAYDTPWWIAMDVSGCQGLVCDGRYFWEDTAGDIQSQRDLGHYAFGSGYSARFTGGGSQNQLSSGLFVNIQATNAGGSQASGVYPSFQRKLQAMCYIDALSNCKIDLFSSNAHYSGRQEPFSKIANALFEFGNTIETAQQAEYYNPDTGQIVASSSPAGNWTLVKNAIAGGARKLKDNNTFSGNIDGITGEPIIGDPGANELYINHATKKTTVRRYGYYEGLKDRGYNTAVADGSSSAQRGGLMNSTYTGPFTGTSFPNAPDWGVMNHVNQQMGNAFEFLKNNGVNGETSAQVLARIDATRDVNARFVHCVMGSNDVQQTGGLAISADTTINNIGTYWDRILKDGKFGVAYTMHPIVSAAADQAEKMLQINKFIRQYCAKNSGMFLIDNYKYCVNPVTGVALPSSLHTDNIHLSQRYCRIGAEGSLPDNHPLRVALPRYEDEGFMQTDTILLQSGNRQLNSNPLMQSTVSGLTTGTLAGVSNTNVAAGCSITYVTGTPTVSPTLVARADGFGNDQVMAITSTGADTIQFSCPVVQAYLQGGKTYVGRCRVSVTGATQLKGLSLYILVSINGFNFFVQSMADTAVDVSRYDQRNQVDLSYMTPKIAIPAGATFGGTSRNRIEIKTFTASSGMVIKVGRMTFDEIDPIA